MAAWFGGEREGADDVKIYVSRFEQGSWTPPAEAAFGIAEQGHPAACYNPVLFQAKGGRLLLFFKVGHEPSKWRGFMTWSGDDGRSWEPSHALPKGFIGPDKDKPMQLADGTILCGSSAEDGGWRVHFEFTDPTASKWSKTESLNDPSVIGAIQPSLLPAGGNAIFAIGRTQQKRLFSIASRDAGRTWGAMRLLDVPNPNAGIERWRTLDQGARPGDGPLPVLLPCRDPDLRRLRAHRVHLAPQADPPRGNRSEAAELASDDLCCRKIYTIVCLL